MAGPDSWDDYISIGKWLIYKKLVVTIMLTLFALLAAAVVYILFLKGIIPPFWQRTAVIREEIFINDDGMVVTVDQDIEQIFTGLGQVEIGNELRFEGIFKNGRFPSTGKIYSPQNELLYEGTVINGNINVRELFNRQAVEWRAAIKETPEIYLYQNYMGYMFPELGLCGIEIAHEESAQDDSDGAINFYILLMDGEQYAPQFPLDYKGANPVEETQIPFLESLLAVQLRHLRDPEISSNLEAVAVDAGNGIYRVLAASAVLETGIFILEEDQSLVIWDNDWYIGGIPQVIHYRRDPASALR